MLHLFIALQPDWTLAPDAILAWDEFDLATKSLPAIRWNPEPSLSDVRLAVEQLSGGTIASVAILQNPPDPERTWLLSEFRGRVITDRTFPHELTTHALKGWQLETDGGDYLVWVRHQPRTGAPVKIVESPPEFGRAILSTEAVAITVEVADTDLADEELFGDLTTGARGGSVALMSMSGATPQAERILLRNPAALALDVLDTLDTGDSLSNLIHDSKVEVNCVGVSASSEDLDVNAFSKPEHAFASWSKVDRSQSQFWMMAEITALVDPPIIIPPGHIFEQQSLNGVQTLAAAVSSSFTLRVGQTRVLAVPAWCLNRNLAGPNGEPLRPTPLRARYEPGTAQDQVWADRERVLAE